jgi:hypothetical protein
MTSKPAGIRSIALALAAAGVLLTASAPAAAINRCEGRDGRVTYTDEPCPATVRSARRVDDSPPVVARTAPAKAPADESKEAREGKAAEGKGLPRDAAEAGKATPAPLQTGRIVASSTPEQEIQRLDELRARQERECAEVNRRIAYARNDLAAAVGPDRASAELALRRLQEEARAVCPAR